MFIPQARFDPAGPRPISVPYTNTSASDIMAGTVLVANGKVQVFIDAIRALNSNNGQNTGSLAIGHCWYDFLADASAVTAAATPFTAVYWNATGQPVDNSGASFGAATGCLTTTAGGNTYVGFTMGEAVSPTIPGDGARVRAWLAEGPNASGISSQSTNVIADPGAAGAIAVTGGGTCELVGTTGSQTRTLAAPTAVGQEITLVTKAITSGTLTITVANLVTAAGVAATTVAQSTAGMVTVLKGVMIGSTLSWSVVSSGGTVS